MNRSILQETEKRVLLPACADAGFQADGMSRFNFGMAARHKCLEPGRYLILMREY